MPDRKTFHARWKPLAAILPLLLFISVAKPGPQVLLTNQDAEAGVYANARSVIDMTRAELVEAFADEMRDLEFDDNGAPLDSLLEKAGNNVEAFFRDFPNTVSKEQVRLERLSRQGRVEASVNRNYLYSFSPDKTGLYWEESRTESNGKPVDMSEIPGFFLAPGRAGMTAFLHPRHQKHCRFRYLGRQASDRNIQVIAFAQKPESGDYLGSYMSEVMIKPALLLYQGFVWLDSDTCQIVRMRTDLLAPRTDVGLSRQTSEIWFGEVRFQSVETAFWLPKEVLITNASLGQTCRNRHRYSEYQVFSVTVQQKIITPQPKKVVRCLRRRRAHKPSPCRRHSAAGHATLRLDIFFLTWTGGLHPY